MAITISPNFQETPDGEVLTDFTVHQRQHLHHGTADEDSDYYEDDFGVLHHRYGDFDPERVQQIEDTLDGDPQALDDSDAEALMGIVGGQDAYSSMIQWASTNLPDDAINEFDSVMDSGDINAIEDAIIWLQDQYLQAGGDSELFVDEPSDLREVVLEVYPHYDQMTEWAQENLTPEAIDDYNAVMESGDRDQIAAYIDQLARLYSDQ